jgi:hypothetical protein
MRLPNWKAEVDFGDRAENHDRGIEIRRGLQLVGAGMGIRDNDYKCMFL